MQSKYMFKYKYVNVVNLSSWIMRNCIWHYYNNLAASLCVVLLYMTTFIKTSLKQNWLETAMYAIQYRVDLVCCLVDPDDMGTFNYVPCPVQYSKSSTQLLHLTGTHLSAQLGRMESHLSHDSNICHSSWDIYERSRFWGTMKSHPHRSNIAWFLTKK